MGSACTKETDTAVHITPAHSQAELKSADTPAKPAAVSQPSQPADHEPQKTTSPPAAVASEPSEPARTETQFNAEELTKNYQLTKVLGRYDSVA